MRKTLFFLPAAVHTGATLCLNLISGALIPLWHIWNVLFWLGGCLLSRGRAWGCFLGLIPAAMVLSLNEGIRGVETAVALAWIVYYLACGALVWRKKYCHSEEAFGGEE